MIGSEISSKVGSIFSSEVKKVEILISEELAAGKVTFIISAKKS
jgi:hypothetical protein